jgi:hypothetical protein
MDDDSTNIVPPWFGPEWPIYPQLAQIVRVTGAAVGGTNPAIYPCVVQQLDPSTLQMRNRETSYVVEPNRVKLVPAYYDARLIGAFQGPGDNSPQPLYCTACCIAGSSSSSSSSGGVPPQPTGFSGTPGLNQALLTWNPDPGATSYNLYRSLSSGGEGSTPYQTGITSTSYTDTGLMNGTNYYYQITGVNSAGESTKSTQVAVNPGSG